MTVRIRMVAMITLSIGVLSAWQFAYAADEQQPPAVGDQAKDFRLKNLAGEEISLHELTKTSNVVLLVLRGYPGYQCPLCTRQVSSFIQQGDKFVNASAKVLMIYPGPADSLEKYAADFLSNSRLPENFELVVDPDFTFTNRYNLRWDALNETAYPSTFVIDQSNEIAYAKVSMTHGNRSKPEEVLKAIP